MRNSKISFVLLSIYALIPFLILGVFQYQHPFPKTEPMFGTTINYVVDLFLPSAVLPALISSIFAYLIIGLRNQEKLSIFPKERLNHLFLSLLFISLFWIETIITDIAIRLRYIAFKDLFVFDFQVISYPSLVIALIGTIAIVIISTYPIANYGNG